MEYLQSPEYENQPPDEPRIAWHAAFVEAIQMELEPYRDLLEFKPEYPLTAEPLEIDMVIIKKAPEIRIEKNIARIFKAVNIVEFKSPEDYFSVYDFYKVLSYAYLYAVLNRVVIQELTITVIESRYPRDLFKYIQEEEQGTVKENSPGIYQISGYNMSIQVIESKKLSPGENLWLRGLNKDRDASKQNLAEKTDASKLKT
ncbi:MAG: hypothetical protein LBL64_03380 [Treponema sp.]|jgi:hypothetical protein|nr:hypothetical protein [Treponema sp.]